ncbi:MAG: ABC transporter ATP-binding protein [Thermoprotei archaeon]|nr:MAG: ABC transporter ATP-binding protein [Thermoprotei archaeon]RLE98168.1 MAG: ABC transporter ATP-binding protein [Thermoprotei archaeon]
MTRVSLRGVTKRFEDVVAVDRVSLEVREGELFTLLGPSGCGKTTTLRIIAGFELPDEGSVFFDNEDVTYKKPYERGCAMVFQNYALWPHMTVYENVAYGLKVRGLPAREIRKRVDEVLELVGLRGLEDRYPTQLSGGQQQRVALARALVVEPKVLLLDEPLSNLDAKLRLRMREEVKKLQKELGITTIYVTHDQEEAMSISDRVAVMNRGRVLQVGTPIEVYTKPANLFVATFIGRSALLRGKIVRADGRRVSILTRGGFKLEGTGLGVRSGDTEIVAVVRPEDFSLSPLPDANIIEGKVELVMFLGPYKQLRVNARGERIIAYVDPEEEVKAGEIIKLYIKPEDVKVYSAEGWEELEFE